MDYIRGLSVTIGAELSGFRAGMATVRTQLHELGSQVGTIGAGITSAFNQSGANVQKFGSDISRVGASLSVALSAPLALLGKQFVDAARESDSLVRGLATVETNSISLKKRLAELLEVAKMPGLGYKEAIKLDTSFRAAGFSADESKRSLLGFGNALASVGKGKGELAGLGVQLTQLSTKTGGFGADIRIIKEYVPQVGKALQAAFGTIDTEKIAKMGLNGKQVIAGILTELEKLPKATGGINNAFENLSDFMFIQMSKIGKAIDTNFNIEGIIAKITGAIGGLVDSFLSLSPVAQKAILIVGGLAIVVPPVLLAIGGIISLLPVLGAGFTALVSPIGAVVVVVGAAVAAIVYHWQVLKVSLKEGGLFEPLVAIAKSVFGILINILQVFTSVFKGNWVNALDSFTNVFLNFGNGIVSIFQLAISSILGLLSGLMKTFGATEIAAGMDKNTSALVAFIGKAKANVPPVTKAIKDLKDEFAGFNFAGVDKGSKGMKGLAGTTEEAAKKAKELAEGTQKLIDMTNGLRAANIANDAQREKADVRNSAEKQQREIAATMASESVKQAAMLALAEDTQRKIETIERKYATKKLDIKQNAGTLDFANKAAPKFSGLAEKTQFLPNVKAELSSMLAGMDEWYKQASEKAAMIAKISSDYRSKISSIFSSPVQNNDTLTKSILSQFDNLSNELKVKVAQMNAVMGEIGTAVSSGFEAFGSALAKGENPFMAFGRSLLSSFGDMLSMIGKKMLAQSAALFALSFITGGALSPVAIRTGLAGGALVTAGAVLKSSAPKFADGWGGATGSTLAWFGDNHDARTNQEFILRKDQVKSILNRAADQAGSGGGGGVGVSYVRGDNIILASNRAVRVTNSIRS